jgi:hypothetical protein
MVEKGVSASTLRTTTSQERKSWNETDGNASTVADEINSRSITLFAGASQARIAKRTSSSCAAVVTARST